jgi:integrase
MGLCQHVYRRGGIYWWRRRLASLDGSCYVHVSLRLRDPDRARQLGRLVNAEAERVVELVRKGMLRSDQQTEVLKRFIGEQIVELDHVALKVTQGQPVLCDDGEYLDQAAVRRTVERRLSKVFALFAVGGAHAALDAGTEEAFRREGLSDTDLIEVGALVRELAPAYAQFQKNAPAEGASVGPAFEYFEKSLADMGIEVTDDAIDHARRLWMRAQSMALADDSRRYGLFRDDYAEVYRRVAMGFNASLSALPSAQAPLGSNAPIPQALAPAMARPAGSRGSSSHNDASELALTGAPISIMEAYELLKESKTSGVTPQWKVQNGPTGIVCETADQFRTLARFLVKMLGADDARLLRQEHVRKLRLLLDTLPLSFGKAAAHWNLTFDELKKDAEDNGKPIGRKPATINRWLGQLNTLVEFIETLGDIQIDRSKIAIFTLDDPEADEEKRKPFETDEARTLFSHRNWSGAAVVHDALYWVPLLGHYELGRMGELLGLLVDDVDLDSEYPAIEIRDNIIRTVKTRLSSERRVPIHPELIRLGFLDYVRLMKSRGEKMLFPELILLRPGTALSTGFSKDWTPLLDEALPEARQNDKTFHSFRKGGNTPMINIHVPETLRLEICGHKHKGTNGKHYKGSIHDKVKLDALAFIPVVTDHLTPRPIRLHAILEALR